MINLKSSNLQKHNIFSQSVYTIMNKFILIFISFFMSVIISRGLGPMLKGDYVTFTSITEMFSIVFNLGLGTSAAYFIGKKNYDLASVIGTLFKITIVFGLIGFIASYIYLGQAINLEDRKLILAICSLTVVSKIWLTYWDDLYLVNNLIKERNRWALTKNILLLLALAICMYVFNNKLVAAVISFSIVMLLLMIYSIIQIKPLFGIEYRTIFFCKINLNFIKEGVKYGSIVFFINMMNFVNYRIDFLMLNFFNKVVDLGYYSTSVGLIEKLWIIPSALSPILFANLISKKSESNGVTTFRMIRYTLIVTAFICVLGIILVKPLILLLYSEQYLQSVNLYHLLVPGILAMIITNYLRVEISASLGKPILMLKPLIISSLSNILLNCVLIPKFSALGAAISSNISYIILTFLLVNTYSKHINRKVWDDIIPQKQDVIYLFKKLRRK